MAIPAGYSSEEFSDDDGLSTSLTVQPQKNRWGQNDVGKKPLSNEENLFIAVLDKNLQEVKKIVSCGVDVNFKSAQHNNWTPLMQACYQGDPEIVKYLLENKADAKVQQELLSPILCLCDSRNVNEDNLIACLELLLENDADINSKDWFLCNPLIYAIKRKNLKLIQKLIELECGMEDPDSDGWTAIFHAVNSGSIELVEILRDAGANMYRIDKKGRNLVEIATVNGNKQMIDTLTTSEIAEDIDELINSKYIFKRINPFENILSEIPDKNKGRMFGYHSEAVRWIHGIGLESYIPIFLERKIQLSEVLTMSEEEMLCLGVAFACDRRKIKYSYTKFHEHGWAKNSLSFPDDEDSLDLCGALNILSKILLHLHVCSAATFFWKTCLKGEISDCQKTSIMNTIKYIRLLEKENKEILRISRVIRERDQLIPCDLIQPKSIIKNNTKKYSLFSFLGLGVIILFGIDRYLRIN